MSMKLTKAQQAWVTMLTKTKERQIIEYVSLIDLDDDTIGYDAFGIAYLSAGIKPDKPTKDMAHVVTFHGYCDQLSPEMVKLLSVLDDQASFKKKVGKYESIAHLNDDGKSFKEIAVAIRKDPSNVFLTTGEQAEAVKKAEAAALKAKADKPKRTRAPKKTSDGEKKQPASKKAKVPAKKSATKKTGPTTGTTTPVKEKKVKGSSPKSNRKVKSHPKPKSKAPATDKAVNAALEKGQVTTNDNPQPLGKDDKLPGDLESFT